jgi:hypothetical protein
MPHTAKLVDVKQIADDAIAICVRCCDDPNTDSWHTHHGIAALSQEEIEQWEQECCDSKSQQHQQTTAALAYFQSKASVITARNAEGSDKG